MQNRNTPPSAQYSSAQSKLILQLITSAVLLTAVTLTLLIPAAGSAQAGPLTQWLPWLMLSLALGLVVAAGGLLICLRRTAG